MTTIADTTSSLPLPIQTAIELLPNFVAALQYACPLCDRAMRPERQECLVKLLTAMLHSCSLQHDGAICAINGDWVRPKVIAELAKQAGISFAQAKRGMADLCKLEFVVSKKIKQKISTNGKYKDVPHRFFTPKFWKVIGLWNVLCHDRNIVE